MPAIRIRLALFALLMIGLFATAQAGLSYMEPPAVLADMVDAPPTPGVSLSPNGQWMLLLDRPGLPSIEEVAQPELRLAGLRINPRTNGRSRMRSLSGLRFRRLADGEERVVKGLPDGARINYLSWSQDGERIAFMVESKERLSLWSAELKDAKARRLGPGNLALNAVYGRPYRWLADSRSLVALSIPAERGPKPPTPLAPDGPVIQENLGRKTPARTYQDLLQNAHDEALYEHFALGQLVKLELKSKRVKKLGGPDVVRSFNPSPDGKYLLVETVRRPYSYSLQEDDFPRRIEVISLKNKLIYQVADLPLQDSVPISFGSVPTGRRSVGWRADVAAELVWCEALDGGDGGVEAEERDQVYTLAAPFDGSPKPLITLGNRYGGVIWGHDDLAFVNSWWWRTRNVKVWRVAPADRDRAPQLVDDRSYQDRYADPGRPVMHPGPFGRQVMQTADDGNVIFLSGDGASPEGDRPFLDRHDLRTDETERLFRSEAPHYEYAVELVDAEAGLLLTRRESQTEPPNYFLRHLGNGELEQKTFFPNPTPALEGITKELIQYERADGVMLSAKLYTPAGFRPGVDAPLPTIVWAYPREFKSAADAAQVTDSPYRFTRVGWWSPMLFLTRGYAVLDGATMPIVGEGDEEPNDRFIEQLVGSAAAAIDEGVRRGVTDRDRVAIGGHSYGAFMAANLLAHSDLFRLGLPRSGAYNRSLTPFGFQGEERSFWEAPEIYFAMSPFMNAEKIDEPILIVHGEADNNSGTYPLQSERLYGALKGLGATARLVMLPHESHGYRARESVMHLIWETDTWLERYLKEAAPRDAAPPEDVSGS
jgi:dipeptidyl aminopeptidase/acylaminoacyl peptidase